jgi:hypothetical protein
MERILFCIADGNGSEAGVFLDAEDLEVVKDALQVAIAEVDDRCAAGGLCDPCSLSKPYRDVLDKLTGQVAF